MTLLAIPTAAAAIAVFFLVLVVRDIRRAERRQRSGGPWRTVGDHNARWHESGEVVE